MNPLRMNRIASRLVLSLAIVAAVPAVGTAAPKLRRAPAVVATGLNLRGGMPAKPPTVQQLPPTGNGANLGNTNPRTVVGAYQVLLFAIDPETRESSLYGTYRVLAYPTGGIYSYGGLDDAVQDIRGTGLVPRALPRFVQWTAVP
jgi:hypothetical protein